MYRALMLLLFCVRLTRDAAPLWRTWRVDGCAQPGLSPGLTALTSTKGGTAVNNKKLFRYYLGGEMGDPLTDRWGWKLGVCVRVPVHAGEGSNELPEAVTSLPSFEGLEWCHH